MGNAQASNYTSTVINSYAKVLQTNTSSAFASSANQVNINVSGGTGDVNISNIISKQTAENDVIASFKQTNDSTVLQKVSQELQQQAESLVKGLNLGNYSDSSNAIDSCINAAMDVSQTISTSCSSTAVNTFFLNVSDQNGNVNIKDINIDQSIKNSLKCATESLNKSSAVQDITQKVDQTAIAKTEGLSMDALIWGLVIIICVVILGLYKIVAKVIPVNVVTAIVVLIIFGFAEYLMYALKVDDINKEIDKYSKVTTKLSEQLKTYNYTCGLYGIGNYTGCFRPSLNTKPPLQNQMKCFFEEEESTTNFSSPDEAYSYFLNDNNLMAIDILSRHDGTYDYHFYKKVSKECITLMDTVSNDSKRVYLPPLICEMYEPTSSLDLVPASSVPEYTFIFTLGGFLYYMENNQWKKINNSSAFVAESINNIKIAITSLDETSIIAPKGVKGTFYFIEMGTARRPSGQPLASTYYYTIYSYPLGNVVLDKDQELASSDFVKVTTIDVTQYVKEKEIGPFMTNPLVIQERNCTVIWNNDTQEKLAKAKTEQKQWYIGMGTTGGVGLLFAMLSLIFVSSPKNQTIPNNK